MQVKEVENENLKRSYEVIIGADEINSEIDSKLNELSKTLKIPGFRPGKVPMNVVKQRHGDAVLGEVLEQVVGKTSQDLIKEKDIRPALQPKIEVKSFENGGDLVYSVTLEIFPEIPEIKWDDINLEEWKVDISDKEIDEGIDRIKEHNKDFAPLKEDRKTIEGDTAVIDFEGFIDGVAFEGGKAEDFNLVLGSKSLIPGFEDQLIDLEKGTETSINVTFPEDYHNKDCAGKPSEFKIKLKDILESVEPELNDEFAVKLGFETLDKLKSSVKEQLEKDYGNLSLSKIKKELFDILDEKHKFDVPEGMVKLEFDSLWNKVQERKNVDPEYKDRSEDELKEEMQQMSERRVRLGIILAETGKAENIEVDQQELRKAVIDQAMQYPGQEQQIISFYEKNPQAIEELRGPVLEDKVVDHVLTKVSKEVKKVSLDELSDFFKNNSDDAQVNAA